MSVLMAGTMLAASAQARADSGLPVAVTGPMRRVTMLQIERV